MTATATPTELAELVADADVVLLPYDSRDQATSGVLIEAVAAGVPVVATGFPHAVELLGRGAGLIARHQDPESMAAAIRTILEAEGAAEQMHEAALRDTHDSVVAEGRRSLSRDRRSHGEGRGVTGAEDDVDSAARTFFLASHRDVRRARSLRTRAAGCAAPRSRVLRRRRGPCARRPAARTRADSGSPPTHRHVLSLPGGCRRRSTAGCTTAWRPAAAGRTNRHSATGGAERFEPSAPQPPMLRPARPAPAR